MTFHQLGLSRIRRPLPFRPERFFHLPRSNPFFSVLFVSVSDIFPQVDPSAQPTHVLIVADPQVLDDKSLPGVSSLIRPFTRWAVDFNLRKSWHAAQGLHPQEVIFLGDMLNGGRYAQDADEYVP